METKQCRACGEIKQKTLFNKRTEGGVIYICKDCKKEKSTKYYKANKSKMILDSRRHKLKQRFGLTLEGYEKKFREQGGVCAICSEQQDIKKLAVDHDHKTGIVRGLLCDLCNRGLGHFKDSSDLLEKAKRYLSARA